MTNSYLETEIERPNYSNYLAEFDSGSSDFPYLANIKDELNIFSDLPQNLFDTEDNQISEVMNRFRELFYEQNQENKLDGILPKLQCRKTEDSAIVVQLRATWTGGKLTIYFSFEENEEDSSYGLFWEDKQNGSYMSKCLLLKNNNIDDLINETISYLSQLY